MKEKVIGVKERVGIVTTNLSETITTENVKRIGELIAVRALKTVIGHSSRVLDDLYFGLLRDIDRTTKTATNFSDGYDIAQTAICFLCGYMGKKLGDETGKYRNGIAITVKHACYTCVNRYIHKKRDNLYNDVCIDDVNENEFEASLDNETDAVESNRAADILNQIILTERDKEVLSYRLCGYTFLETAKLLSLNLSTIINRMWRIRQKYGYLFTNKVYKMKL